jgi:hypothetical protein
LVLTKLLKIDITPTFLIYNIEKKMFVDAFVGVNEIFVREYAKKVGNDKK